MGHLRVLFSDRFSARAFNYTHAQQYLHAFPHAFSNPDHHALSNPLADPNTDAPINANLLIDPKPVRFS